MNQRLSFVPFPVTHVLRDGKKYFVDGKDLIVSDIVYLDSKISSIIPADILLIETSEEFLIASYLDTFDSKNKYFSQLRDPKVKFKPPPHALKKIGLMRPNDSNLLLEEAPPQ